jgi:hypothetical protein
MTKRHAVEDAKLSESEQLRSSDFLGVTRREVIAIGAAGIAFLTSFDDPAQADAEGNTGAVSEHRSGAEQQQQTVSRADGNVSEQRPEEHVEKYSNVMSLLGSEFRGRSSSIQTLTTHQLYGTGTREGPDRREVDAGDYFSDGFNRKLMSSSGNPLATALRTRSEGINSTTRLFRQDKAALSAYLGATAQKQQPNEGRAEVLFGAVGKVAANTVGAFVTGAAGKALGAPTLTMAGLSGAGFTSLGKIFETPGREAGEAFGRWLDPNIEQFKEGVRYDSRTDPRYNPFGWPYD